MTKEVVFVWCTNRNKIGGVRVAVYDGTFQVITACIERYDGESVSGCEISETVGQPVAEDNQPSVLLPCRTQVIPVYFIPVGYKRNRIAAYAQEVFGKYLCRIVYPAQ